MKDNITFEQLGTVKAYNADCMQIMKQYPDKYFDLAIVDPEYGGDDQKRSLQRGCRPTVFYQ